MKTVSHVVQVAGFLFWLLSSLQFVQYAAWTSDEPNLQDEAVGVVQDQVDQIGDLASPLAEQE